MMFWTHVQWFVQEFVFQKFPQGGSFELGFSDFDFEMYPWNVEIRFNDIHILKIFIGTFWTQIQWFKISKLPLGKFLTQIQWCFRNVAKLPQGGFWTQVQWCFRNVDFVISPGGGVKVIFSDFDFEIPQWEVLNSYSVISILKFPQGKCCDQIHSVALAVLQREHLLARVKQHAPGKRARKG